MRNPFLELLTTEETPVPGTFWATVTGVDPLRVQRDGEPVLAITPATLATLDVGDRVLCLLERRQVVVLGKLGGQPKPPEPAYPEPNRVQIGDKSYLLAGSIAPPAFTWSSALDNLYLATVRVPQPYEPPWPYTFLWSTQESGAWTVCMNRDRFPADGTMVLRIAQFANADTTQLKRIQWQLVNA